MKELSRTEVSWAYSRHRAAVSSKEPKDQNIKSCGLDTTLTYIEVCNTYGCKEVTDEDTCTPRDVIGCNDSTTPKEKLR